MKRGEQARADVMDTIVRAFKDVDAYECTADKKIYVWAQDGAGGERIQFAVSITAPKNPVLAGGTPTSSDVPWDEAPQTSTPAVNASSTPMELSADDKAKVQALMEQLGLK